MNKKTSKNNLSIYIHLPFCRKKCGYCSFYSTTTLEGLPEYAEAVVRCLRHMGKKHSASFVTSVYLGGGTPSLLQNTHICAIMSELRHSFRLSDDCEITFELNPESTTLSKLSCLKEQGINRLSLGVQSLCDTELAAIGRPHDSKTALAAIDMIFNSGFVNVGADVIFGLPNQTTAVFEETLSRLAALPLTHISCYALQLEEGTPLYNSTGFADQDEMYALYSTACRLLAQAGYLHDEISNFAMPCRESRHNNVYWSRGDYLGIGPAAHSLLNGQRCAFAADTKRFIQNKSFEFDSIHTLAAADIKTEQIMLGLRTARGINKKMLNGTNIAPYIQNGLAALKGERFCLTDKGMFVSNSIILRLLEQI